MGRSRHVERHPVPQHDDAFHAVLQPLHRVAHRFLARGVLLEGVRNHEVPELTVRVEILHVGLDDVRGLDGIAGLEGALDDAAGLQVANADAVEGLALARLHHFILDDRVRIVFENDFDARFELVGGNAAHVCVQSVVMMASR